MSLKLVQCFLILWAMCCAYDIRLYPIKDFGMIIHEYDPWFNFRAAEYMAEHGISKFNKWYDYMSWYPIGRPIGTTIYPGMQMTACGIREMMDRIPEFKVAVPKKKAVSGLRKFIAQMRKWGFTSLPKIPKVIDYAPMSLNDICCMIPAWFGSIASLFTGLFCYEITRSMNAAVVATGLMAILPAHLMRSMGGGFDNECVAMAAICSTFWLWLRSVRTPNSWVWGILAGLSYIYAVLAWGGYIFVLNMVGVHALMLVALGRFNSGVYKAYSLFFAIGTVGAIQVPVVGWQPLRSCEQMGPLLVFLGYQVLAFCDYCRRRDGLSTIDFVKFRVAASALFLIGLAAAAVLLWPMGYFGPPSSRIRGLFVEHTKTGNPLVDSVAEHEPASSSTYATYLNLPLDYAFHGGAVCLWKRTSGCYFALLYAWVAHVFSGKMSRLVLICAPICAVGCAIFVGFVLDFALEPLLLILGKQGYQNTEDDACVTKTENNGGGGGSRNAAKAKSKTHGEDTGKSEKQDIGKGVKESGISSSEMWLPLAEYEEECRPGGMMHIKHTIKSGTRAAVPHIIRGAIGDTRAFVDRNIVVLCARLGISVAICFMFMELQPQATNFVQHCHEVAQSLSDPEVVTWMQHPRDGRVKMDDYYKGYLWLGENTPKDARVLAWWDYGYQITGIANRTSIADGNTWNHEHIAMLGKILTGSEEDAHNAIRHLADYVLVRAGGDGDDLDKSPHLARIGNSVFPDHCGDDDPYCGQFGFYEDGSPSPMMNRSFLYRAVKHNLGHGAKLNPKYFREVYCSEHVKLRIFKVWNVSSESKAWVADPENRVCDAPGSWYCVGQYPPDLEPLISKRRSFVQVEDFNKQGQSSSYTKMVEMQRGNSEL